MQQKNIILDFDGTLADSLPLVIELFNAMSLRNKLTEREIDKFREMSAKDLVTHLGVPLWRVPALLVKGRIDLGRRLHEVPIFPGMEEVVRRLFADGHTLFLLSSNSSENIRAFLKAHDIERYFTNIHGNTGIFSKAKALRHIMKRYRLNAADCFSIGDEVRDIEAAHRAGITSIAVSWGYNGPTLLKTYRPDFIVDKPQAILDIFTA